MINITELLWDLWNVAHIARHDIVPDDVEEICRNEPIVQQGKKGRLLIIGITDEGKVLTVILDPENKQGVYYPVTARTASKRERKIFATEKQGGEE